MKRCNGLILLVTIGCLISSFAFCNTSFAVDDEKKINYLDNGTLFNHNIHHRRPAKGIAQTKESRKGKSFAENITYSVYSNFTSRYAFQGMASSDGAVWQPSATIEAYGVGFSAWGDFVLANIPDQGKMNEVDLTLYYNYEIGGFTIHPYMLACIYPTSNKLSLDYSAYTDVEPSLHLAYTTGPLSFFTDFTVYVHPQPGAFFMNAGIGLQHNLPLRFGLEMYGMFSFANSKFNRNFVGVNKNAVSFFEYSISFPWNPIKGLVFTPNAHVSAFFSQQFRDVVRYPVMVWGGLSVAYNF